VIGKSYPFSLDWKFLVKNVVLIGVLSVVMFLLKEYFVEELAGGRWSAFWILFLFFVGYGGVLALANRGKIKLLIGEVKKIRE
jgi:hypothetical protein